MALVKQLDQMRVDNLEKDKKIAILENRVADLEQYTRINDVIITGLSIKPQSYARAVTRENGGEPAELDVTSTERQIVGRGEEDDSGAEEGCSCTGSRAAQAQVTMVRSGEERDSEAEG
ncbi:hypothetical protein AAFF_G00135080 [Aldrovandia affinis]|uniref:Uncharacterized protein n=1 Tax=Aldrovandia affinis TaxID=143900 RepID=A0AAD7RQ48_9TELE|nr:hypothetical protein AAFF_G00135080 [Aldrovandia affinis]